MGSGTIDDPLLSPPWASLLVSVLFERILGLALQIMKMENHEHIICNAGENLTWCPIVNLASDTQSQPPNFLNSLWILFFVPPSLFWVSLSEGNFSLRNLYHWQRKRCEGTPIGLFFFKKCYVGGRTKYRKLWMFTSVMHGFPIPFPSIQFKKNKSANHKSK